MAQKRSTSTRKKNRAPSSKSSPKKITTLKEISGASFYKRKTKDQLIDELQKLHRKIKRLEKTKDKLRQHESLLKESEDRFKKLYERAPLGYQSLDENGFFMEVNEAWLRTLDYEKDEVIGKWFGDFLPDEYKDVFRRNFSRFKSSESVSGVEFEMLKKDGSTIIVSFDGRIGKGIDGNFLQTHSILQDITGQKEAEEALRKSEEKFRTLVENAPMAMSIVNVNGDIEFINSKHIKLTGYSHDEIPNLKHWWSKAYQDGGARKTAIDGWNGFISSGSTGEDIGIVERKIVCKDKTIKHIELSYMRNKDKVIVAFNDVTERRRAENALRESEKRYRDFIQGTNDLVTRVDGDGNFIFVNHMSEEFFGIPADECLGKYALQFIHPDDAGRTMAGYKEFIRSKVKAGTFENRQVSMDGKVTHVLWNSTFHYDEDGNLLFVDGIARDITERKRESTRLREIINSTLAGYFYIDKDGLFQKVNAAWLKMHKYSSEDEIVGKHFSITQVDMDLEKAKEFVSQMFKSGESQTGEFSRLCKDGSIGYHSYTVRPVMDGGEVAGIEGFLIDTTELNKAKRDYGLIFNQMQSGFALHEIICDDDNNPVDYRFLAINPAFEKQTGMKASGFVGKRVLELMPDLEKKWIDIYGKVALTGEPVQFENYAEGLDKYFEVVAFCPQKGQFACIFNDISVRKMAEEALKESKERLDLVIERMPTGCIMWDAEFKAELWNPKAESIFGFSSEEALGKHAYELIVEKSVVPHIDKAWESLLTGGRTAHSINENMTKSGKQITCEWYNTPLLQDGKIIGVIAMVQDVTEQKLADQKIKSSLKEKEVLLKEIHHRVKNNMAVISSLLSLPSGYVDDKKYVDMFNESQSRIRSMALVHEKLYQSDDFAHIDVQDYVSSLAQNVKSTFMGKKDVSTDISVEAMDLDIDNLIPCGLIINELLTNALKHAFDGVDSPEISISMVKVDEDNVCLTIRDNGIGLPEGFDISRSKGLGLKLVLTLTRQLDGKLEAVSGNGTTFRLTFPEKFELARHLSDNG